MKDGPTVVDSRFFCKEDLLCWRRLGGLTKSSLYTCEVMIKLNICVYL